MVVRSVNVVPTRTLPCLLQQAVWVTRRHDLDVGALLDQALRERSGVILHATDAVARHSDDANPHGEADLRESRLVRGLSR
jgi:hypothetical protein